MALKNGNSLFNSLRGIIWISTSVLAFFICTFGLISYLVVTLLTNEVFYAIFIPFLFLAFSVIVFGWWLSNELVNPIDKVTLLAKSLERNSSSSLPKTSGSSETDQLLQILHRNSQQMQNVVTLMDKVANGNVDVALTPLKGSDRLTASFQKLLSKVSESINAKEELTKLENEIEALKNETSAIKNGNLNAELNSEYRETREIAETVKYLLEKLNLLITLIKVDSYQADHSANEVEKTLENLVKDDENNIQEINMASNVLQKVPNLIEKISDELMSSAKSAEHTIEKTRQGTEISQSNAETTGQLRSKLREAVNLIQSLNERSQEIAKVANLVEDVANRTNMIALNASIQATEMGEDGRGFVLISEELERLAERTNGTNKQLSTLNKAILTEIGKVEDSIKISMGEVADLSKFAVETNNILGELERYVIQFLNLQDNLITLSTDQSDETDRAYETIASFLAKRDDNIKYLKDSADQTKTISQLMKNLQQHTAEFRVAAETNELPRTSFQPLTNGHYSENSLPDDETGFDGYSTQDFNAAKLTTEEFEKMTYDSKEFDSAEIGLEESDTADALPETSFESVQAEEFRENELNSPELSSDNFFDDGFEIEGRTSDGTFAMVSENTEEEDILNLQNPEENSKLTA